MLDGVAPSDITLVVSAASVRVAATIAMPSFALADAALQTIQVRFRLAMLDEALGVTIESMESLTIFSGTVEDSSSSVGAAIGGAIGGAVVLIAVVAGAFVLRRRRLTRSRQAAFAQSAGVAIHHCGSAGGVATHHCADDFKTGDVHGDVAGTSSSCSAATSASAMHDPPYV